MASNSNSAVNFGNSGTGLLTPPSGTDESPLEYTAEQYMGNTSYRPSPTTISEQPEGSFFSANPTEMQTVWDLPANVGTLRLPSGVTTQTPASSASVSKVQSGMQMLTLYVKFEQGDTLSAQDISAATALGGDVARAAQLLATEQKQKGTSKGRTPQSTEPQSAAQPAKPLSSATVNRAVVKAQSELSKRMQSTIGVTGADLTAQGIATKVPKQLANVMQNAGYPVTQSMTLGAAVQVATGPSAQTPMTTIPSNQTIAQYLQSLAKMSKQQIYSLQQQLYNGGFYDESYYEPSGDSDAKTYVQGVLDTGTILAMRKAILQTLANNASGQSTTLEQTIGGGTSAYPVLGAGSTLSTSAQSVPLATTAQTQQPLINAFTAALGRAPSQAELNAFTTQYNTDLENADKTLTEEGISPQGLVDYTTGIPYVQGKPTVSEAATTFAENTNPSEYQAHNVADAFGMLMNLIDRQNVSAYTTVGNAPNRTS